jgi:hypothetical protein
VALFQVISASSASGGTAIWGPMDGGANGLGAPEATALGQGGGVINRHTRARLKLNAGKGDLGRIYIARTCDDDDISARIYCHLVLLFRKEIRAGGFYEDHQSPRSPDGPVPLATHRGCLQLQPSQCSAVYSGI